MVDGHAIDHLVIVGASPFLAKCVLPGPFPDLSLLVLQFRNVTSITVEFLFTTTYRYDYYQYTMSTVCADLWITVNASIGYPAVLVSTTGDELPLTELTLGWTSNSYYKQLKTVPPTLILALILTLNSLAL